MVLVATNVLAYLMFDGDRTAAAQELYERDPDWRGDAFIMELSNGLSTDVRGKAPNRDQALKVLAGAETLIALAMQLKTRLVTEDAKLRIAVPSWIVPLSNARV